jgi:hypothetical protein
MSRHPEPTEDQTHFKAAVVYIAENGSKDPSLGRTKVFKALILADILAMSSLGRTITGWRYLKFDHGPVPLKGDEVIEDLTREGFISELDMRIGSFQGKRMVFQRRIEEIVFSAEDRSLLDMAIGIVTSMTAKDVRHLSHDLPAYKWSQKDKIIDEGLLRFPYLITERKLVGRPYEAALASAREQGLV